jgi:hypothetical protein
MVEALVEVVVDIYLVLAVFNLLVIMAQCRDLLVLAIT